MSEGLVPPPGTLVIDDKTPLYGDCCEICAYTPPTTCCKGTATCLCFDGRFAFPCDDEVPCLLNTCGLTCCYNWGCNVGNMIL